MTGVGEQAVLNGRYELERELGRGASGVVYSARDRTDGRHVAIKLARKPSRPGETLPASLTHEHLVTVFERGADADFSYVVMERIDGFDLSRYCTPQTRLPLEVTFSVMARVATALDYLHRHDLVHGDMKPANVLYDPRSDIVKLVDAALVSGADSRLNFRGTPAYKAPEQVCGAVASAAGDAFSFGVTLYQLSCGALPFSAASLPQLLFSIVHDKHDDIRTQNASVPADFVVLIERLLEKDPAVRCRDMDEIAAGLNALCGAPHADRQIRAA